MLQVAKADILSFLDPFYQKTVVLHGCNCFHTMGSGIAKYLRQQFPIIYTVDVSTTVRGDKDKLGTFSTAVISDNFHILNCYTQYNYGREKKLYANYIAIEECFKEVARRYDTSCEIRMPKIGCGLAGGDWNIVSKALITHLGNRNVKVYYR